MKTIFTSKSTFIKSAIILVNLLFATSSYSQSKFVIEASNTKFSPNELTVSVGDTVVWNNIQGYHNVNATQATYPLNPESFGNSPGNGWTFQHVFTIEGTYDYQCDPHVGLGMVGKIHVTANHNKYVVEVTRNVFTPDELKIYPGDTVEWRNLDGYHNVNGTQATYPLNPESFGNSPGNGWTLTHVFLTPGKYDYRCDPHFGLGMTGKIEVMDNEMNDDTTKYMLTVNFTNMNPHVGQMLYLSVVDINSGKEIERTTEDINVNFSMQVSGIEKNHSYKVDFFADHNGNGMYDAPPTDHAWRMELNNATGDTTLMFTHNTGFTDINWKNRLTVHFMGMNPHVGQNLNLKVYDKNSGIVVQEVDTTVTVDFMIYVYGIENGMAYNVDFYVDHNMNGMYDAPPADHAWRLELNNVIRDTTLMFTHNINFTDIRATTSINQFTEYRVKIYPNPADDIVTIETSGINLANLQVIMYDITGKIKYSATGISANMLDIDLNSYPNGVYIVELRTNDYRKMLKLLKN